jgi:hypothetical protein
MKMIYLTLSVLGLLGTFYYGVQVKQLDLSSLSSVSMLYKTILFDTFFASLVSIVFINMEASRLKMKGRIIYLILSLTFPIAAVFPFFLFKREQVLEKKNM